MSIKIETSEHLEACPFCGTPAQLSKGQVYNRVVYRVECPRCHVSAAMILVGKHLMYSGECNVDFTEEQAKQQAITNWNTRIVPMEVTA